MDGNIDKIDANLKLSNEMSHVVVGVPVLPKDYLDGERCPSGLLSSSVLFGGMDSYIYSPLLG
jgi:hypothetical protein